MKQNMVTVERLAQVGLQVVRDLPPAESLYRRYMREIREEDFDRPLRDQLVPSWCGPVRSAAR